MCFDVNSAGLAALSPLYPPNYCCLSSGGLQGVPRSPLLPVTDGRRQDEVERKCSERHRQSERANRKKWARDLNLQSTLSAPITLAFSPFSPAKKLRIGRGGKRQIGSFAS